MQEKDLKQKLNQELEEMAPDILENILSTPREPIKNEKELFGDNKPLFKEKKLYPKTMWFIVAAAVFAVAIIAATIITISNRTLIPQNQDNLVAYSITMDVNPSIIIDVGHDEKVVKLTAGNDDAKKIVAKINKKITKDTAYEEVMAMAINKINKKHYFDKKDSAMLVSVVSENEKSIEGKKAEIKDATIKIVQDQKIKCKSVYQECVVTDEIKTVAQKNKVSVGKAALCMKIAEKENKSVKKMCKKKISALVKEAEKTGIIVTDEIVYPYTDAVVETQEQIETEETGETYESESTDFVDETESMAENETESAGDIGIPAESSGEEEAVN